MYLDYEDIDDEDIEDLIDKNKVFMRLQAVHWLIFMGIFRY